MVCTASGSASAVAAASAEAARGMYGMRPVYEGRIAIDLPTNMYRLRPVYSDLARTSAVSSSGSTLNGDLKELENRQLDILRRLGDLQKEVDKLCGIATPNNGASSHDQLIGSAATVPPPAVSSNSDLGSARDIVIACNPKQIPLSVLVLVDMLSSKFRVHRCVHVHSSASCQVDARATEVLEALGFRHDFIGVRRQEPDIIVTWLWKDVPFGCHVIAVPLRHVPIEGERCVARYLWSLLEDGSGCGDATAAFHTDVDSWLDLSATLFGLAGEAADKGIALRRLGARVGRESWLVGDTCSLADIVVFSALHSSGALAANKRRDDGVSRWSAACASLPQFARVIAALARYKAA